MWHSYSVSQRKSSDWQELVETLREISQEMLDLAGQDAWQEVTEREHHRQSIIMDLFAEPIPADAVPNIESCIRDVLAVDAKIKALSQAQKERFAKEMAIIRQGQKALCLYSTLEG